jgi:hypothetical protein
LGLAATIIAAVVVAFVAFAYSETYRLEVKSYTYASPKVPPAFDGTRIVLLTDIHRSFFFSQQRVADIVAKVNDLHPDMVVLGGDYVYGTKDLEAPTFAALAKLTAPLGVYAVLGNHDYAHLAHGVNDPAVTKAAAAEAGIPLLDNRGLWIGKSGQRFRLGGVSDLTEGTPFDALAVQGATPADFVVLVSHEPDFAEYLLPGDADLVLSGHTHGGLITFFGLWTPLKGSGYGHLTGVTLTKDKKTTVIVSNGVGTIFPPLRFFARPQIVVVTLKRAV